MSLSQVAVLKELKGWFKGFPADDPSNSGIFPVSYIKLSAEPVLASLLPARQPPAAQECKPPAEAKSEASQEVQEANALNGSDKAKVFSFNVKATTKVTL